jgi:hypothetical protein
MINTVILPRNGYVRGAKPRRRVEICQEAVQPSYGAFQTKQQKTADIAGRLLEAAGKILYGSAGVILKIHAGRIVDVTYNLTESTREHVKGGE